MPQASLGALIQPELTGHVLVALAVTAAANLRLALLGAIIHAELTGHALVALAVTAAANLRQAWLGALIHAVSPLMVLRQSSA
jgi:uncharacterized membrane protein